MIVKSEINEWGQEIPLEPGPTGQTVVLGGNGLYGKWGYGASLKEAKKAFRSVGGVQKYGYTVLHFDTDTEFLGVDGLGRAHWKGNEPVVNEIAPKG